MLCRVRRWRWRHAGPVVDGRLFAGRTAAGDEGVQGGQPGVPAAGLQEGRGPLRGGHRGRPQPERRPTSSSATATTTSTSRAEEARPQTTRCSTKAVENYQQAADKLSAVRQRGRQEARQALARVSGRGLRRRQAERSGQGRTGRPEDDPARAGRAVQLLRAREDLRGRRRVSPRPSRC